MQVLIGLRPVPRPPSTTLEYMWCEAESFDSGEASSGAWESGRCTNELLRRASPGARDPGRKGLGALISAFVPSFLW